LLLLAASAYAVALARTASAQAQQPVRHSYTEVGQGKGIPSKGAVQASFHSYRSEDGTAVVQDREWYKSASDARSGLETLAKKASRVVKQGTRKNEEGRIVAKQVELIFSQGHNASPEMVIAWTDGASVVRLSSASLPLLLDFENQNYPSNSETTRK